MPIIAFSIMSIPFVLGQPDYSAQWADYYRSMGMHREAEAIEQQAKGMKAATAGGPGPNAAGPQQVCCAHGIHHLAYCNRHNLYGTARLPIWSISNL